MNDVGLPMRRVSRCNHGVMTRNKVADRVAILREQSMRFCTHGHFAASDESSRAWQKKFCGTKVICAARSM